MPRPGPRPYECVRRAWHSDRHHPIRGSLIQEIFRVVNEVHCSATKKNSEWQETLPIVVLKAEEIMYSKANSEAEYSDLQTLWGRVNDAINTIIRRDESTETGDLLQPCIEAALHLGCTPRISSRSQRNDTPRDYLRPEKLEGTSVLDSNSNTKACGNPASTNPLILRCPQYSTLDTINPFSSSFKDQDHSFQSRNSNHIKEFLVLPKKSAPSDNHHAPPLYYNNQIRPNNPKLCSSKPSNSKSQLLESVKTGPSNHDHTFGKERGIECDLTLRLGSPVVPCAGTENSCPQQVENGLIW
ncbi:hypothetical protein ACS0TY_020606 [Phlomoides rotata]